MKKLGVYLDKIKEIKELRSDKKLAEELGKSRQHISRIRDTNTAGHLMCVEMAKILNLEELEIISLVEYYKTDDKVLKEVWLKIHNNSKE